MADQERLFGPFGVADPHPLVLATYRHAAIDPRNSRRRVRVRPEDLDILTTRESFVRGLHVWDVLLKALDDLGVKVWSEDALREIDIALCPARTRADFEGCMVGLRIKEKGREERREGLDGDHFGLPKFDRKPTGNLRIVAWVGLAGSWREFRVEPHLHIDRIVARCVKELFRLAAEWKEKRRVAEERRGVEEARRREAEARERERQERERIERERIEWLKRLVADWEFARKVRELVAEARQKLGPGAGSDFSARPDWAAGYADGIDPLAPQNIGRLPEGPDQKCQEHPESDQDQGTDRQDPAVQPGELLLPQD
jgi:hypothetical protein